MPQLPPSSRLQETARIAQVAAEAALTHFHARAALIVSTKSPEQVVTDADRNVETILRDAMALAFPGETIVGEEFGGKPTNQHWAIDPIDGTANFLDGLPLWGVAIGHTNNGTADLGVIALPCLGLTVSAHISPRGSSLFVNSEPHTRAPTPVPSISLGHSSGAALDETLHLHRLYRQANFAVHHWRCSAVSLAWAATGHINGHMHRHTTLWDSIPGAALCHAAGLETQMGTWPDGSFWIKTGDASAQKVADGFWTADSAGPH